MKEGKLKRRWIWVGLLSLLLIAVLSVAGVLYSWIYRPALTQMDEDISYIYIPTGSDYKDLIQQFEGLDWHNNLKAFEWVAERKNLAAHIYPGRYEVFKGMSNDSLINLLRSGVQSEVMLTFTSKRSFEQLAGNIADQIEADSISLIEAFRDPLIQDSLGFRPEEWFGMFVPNSYRFFWNTDARSFINRMHQEYLRFWNSDRKNILKALGMSINEVVTLASIVQDETNKTSDMPIIAGVYINRLNKGIKLQACPTVVYAWGEPRIKRVLNRHLKIDSDYNTYKHAGLPPGPIRIPSIQAIEACLNYSHHDYLYFCAKEDLSGDTVFAKTYVQHLVNSRKYQQALNDRKIF